MAPRACQLLQLAKKMFTTKETFQVRKTNLVALETVLQMFFLTDLPAAPDPPTLTAPCTELQMTWSEMAFSLFGLFDFKLFVICLWSFR